MIPLTELIRSDALHSMGVLQANKLSYSPISTPTVASLRLHSQAAVRILQFSSGSNTSAKTVRNTLSNANLQLPEVVTVAHVAGDSRATARFTFALVDGITKPADHSVVR
jgi:hypothetical protein